MLRNDGRVGSLYTAAGQRKYLTTAERSRFLTAAHSCPRADLQTLCLISGASVRRNCWFSRHCRRSTGNSHAAWIYRASYTRQQWRNWEHLEYRRRLDPIRLLRIPCRNCRTEWASEYSADRNPVEILGWDRHRYFFSRVY